MAISDELYRILVQWRDDATSDNPSEDAQWFGLCNYVTKRSTWAREVDEMRFLLRAEYGWTDYPFNRPHDGLDRAVNYARECGNSEAHLNPHRRRWVERRIHEYEMDHGGQ